MAIMIGKDDMEIIDSLPEVRSKDTLINIQMLIKNLSDANDYIQDLEKRIEYLEKEML